MFFLFAIIISIYYNKSINNKEGKMKHRTKAEQDEFIKQNFITCKKCGYNNEKGRFNQYGTCLKCGSILDEKTHFKIEMLKKLHNNRRKSC